MFFKRLTLCLLCSVSLLHLWGQDSLLLRDFRFVLHDNAWLTSGNAAALSTYSSRNISLAEARLAVGRGGLVNYYDAASQLDAAVSIASFYRLSPRVVAAGTISYDNWSGSDMTGSAFINPERKPFNLAEDSLTNSGDKHLDTYRLSGGVAFDVWRGMALGAHIDYTAANYAKYKDLRHKNKLMDLHLSASIFAPVTPWLSLGAGYTYQVGTESITFGTYGKSEKVYKTLIDYGGFFGRVEQFGNEGYTDRSREMPLFEDGHGGQVQMELRPLAALSIMGGFGLSHATGYYGRRSPYTPTYTAHKRNRREARARVQYRHCASRFSLDATYSKETLTNHAETFRELTNEGGANYYEYYDPVETADKTWKELQLTATAQLAIRGELPTWSASVAYHWAKRRQTAYLYPFFRWQQLSSNSLSVSLCRNLLTRSGVWTLTLNGAFLKGSGQPFRDFAFVTPSQGQELPATMEAFLWREYQYLTAAQYTIGGSVKYAFRFPGTQLKTHAALSATHRKANQTFDYSTGRDRTLLAVAIGCTF